MEKIRRVMIFAVFERVPVTVLDRPKDLCLKEENRKNDPIEPGPGSNDDKGIVVIVSLREFVGIESITIVT